jgi:hypothetical protein
MGLFNILKEQRDPTPELLNDPRVRSAGAGVALEDLPKRVANLITAGRTDEAKDMIAFFLKTYANERGNEKTSATDLARISYYLAYRALPDLIYSRWDEFLHLWKSVVPFPIYLAIKGASDQCKWVSFEQIRAFKCSQGALKAELDYYLIEFPAPPPQTDDLKKFDALIAQFAQGKKPSPDGVPVLGPYFAAVLLNKTSSERQLYVLGQSPGGGTTLRRVSGPGAHMNVGGGSAPTPQAFLDLLRKRA